MSGTYPAVKLTFEFANAATAATFFSLPDVNIADLNHRVVDVFVPANDRQEHNAAYLRRVAREMGGEETTTT